MPRAEGVAAQFIATPDAAHEFLSGDRCIDNLRGLEAVVAVAAGLRRFFAEIIEKQLSAAVHGFGQRQHRVKLNGRAAFVEIVRITHLD